MSNPSGGQLGRDVHRSLNASTVGIAALMLQDQGGGLKPVSFLARKRNPAERGNTYSAYNLKTLAVCEAVKHTRCYLEG
jgi:hypothetical protein